MLCKPVLFTLLVAASSVGGVLVQQSVAPQAQQASHSKNTANQPRWSLKNPAEVLGFESCRKCHKEQIDKLVATPHFKSYETLHRSAAAKQYCQQLGLRSVKRSERCVRCHYTPEVSSRGVKAQSGISCESCHGPAQNWIKGHNDYGGVTITKETETPEHKQWRIANSIHQGMRHPANLYLLARSCYECHLVDDVELVNKTAHSVATPGFNMVAWSQGQMRHNFFRSGGKSNEISSPERLRVMFVTDLMTRFEFLYRALAASPADSRHYTALLQQLYTTRETWAAVNQATDNLWVQKANEVISGSPGTSAAELESMANALSEITFEFASREKEHSLKPIENLLPKPNEYRQ